MSINIADTKKSDIELFGKNTIPAFDSLAKNIKYSFACGEGNTLIFTAVDKTSDAEAVCVNTASALIRLGYKVLVIDSNFRNSTITSSLLSNQIKHGLSDALCGYCKHDEAIQRLGEGKPDMIGIGNITPNPTNILVQEYIKTLLSSVKSSYDWVLVSLPPVTTYADALAFCGLSEGVVLVARERNSKTRNIKTASERVRYSGGNITGIVLTNSLSALQN